MIQKEKIYRLTVHWYRQIGNNQFFLTPREGTAPVTAILPLHYRVSVGEDGNPVIICPDGSETDKLVSGKCNKRPYVYNKNSGEKTGYCDILSAPRYMRIRAYRTETAKGPQWSIHKTKGSTAGQIYLSHGAKLIREGKKCYIELSGADAGTIRTFSDYQRVLVPEREATLPDLSGTRQYDHVPYLILSGSQRKRKLCPIAEPGDCYYVPPEYAWKKRVYRLEEELWCTDKLRCDPTDNTYYIERKYTKTDPTKKK